MPKKLVKSRKLVGNSSRKRSGSTGPSLYGVHSRKIDDKLFKSFGLGGFFKNKEAAEALAKAERGYGAEARVVPVEGGYRVFLRPTKQTTKQSDVHKQNIGKSNPSNFDPRKAKVGDIVEARFTNVAGDKVFPARITKVLKNNVRVVRTDGKPVWPGDDPKREFVIQKIGTVNNGIFKLKGGNK